MNTKIIVTDISFYQYGYKDPPHDWTITRYVDFVKLASVTPAVIIRAGQNLWKDIAFDVSWKGAKDAGLLRGSYFFYDSRVDPKKQAKLWADVLGDDKGEFLHFADFEDRYGGKYKTWRDWYDFLEESKRLINRPLGIYTGYYYWREHMVDISAQQLAYFGNYPLWIAAYGGTAPRIPAPWGDWLLWQFSDNGDGKAYGVASGNIDLNYFNGTAEDFENRFGVGDSPKSTLTADFGGRKVVYNER
jgi:GH25 family lysozyme M1 (1,4-beta-N-acetylmuramidase)